MEPILTLFEREPAPRESLPPALAAVYGGGLVVPEGTPEQPYVIVNFVETLDGVVSYELAGKAGGGSISGESAADHAVMGLLRARADAVLFGSGSLREDSGHIRVPEFIAPALAAEYADLRAQLGRPDTLPLNVVVSASGHVDLAEPTFSYPGLRVVIATTARGAARLSREALPPGVEIRALPEQSAIGETDEGAGAAHSAGDGGVSPRALLALLGREYGVRVALHEGGPKLLGAFLADGAVDELFLTLAPQLAGRVDAARRPALVEGYAFTPDVAPWATLLSLKRAGSHLLLRYGLGKPLSPAHAEGQVR